MEVGGVLKPGACRKGPSMDPADKRRAVMVREQTLVYTDVEAIIS